MANKNQNNMTDEKESLEEQIDDIKKHAISAALEWLAANAKVIGVIVAVIGFVNFGVYSYVKKEIKQTCDTLFPADENHISTESHYALMTSATEQANKKCDARVMIGAKECARALADCESANEGTQ